MYSYIIRPIQRKKSIRRQHLTPRREGMAYLEQRRDRETLVQLGAQAGEHEVGEEDIALHLPRDRVDGAGVAEAERCSSGLEGAECVEDGVHEAVGAWRGGAEGDGDGCRGSLSARRCRHLGGRQSERTAGRGSATMIQFGDGWKEEDGGVDWEMDAVVASSPAGRRQAVGSRKNCGRHKLASQKFPRRFPVETSEELPLEPSLSRIIPDPHPNDELRVLSKRPIVERRYSHVVSPFVRLNTLPNTSVKFAIDRR